MKIDMGTGNMAEGVACATTFNAQQTPMAEGGENAYVSAGVPTKAETRG
jgi:hypothetical protein